MDEATGTDITRSPSRAGNRTGSLTEEIGSTERKVRIGFAFALTCLALVGLVSYLSIVRLNENAARVDRTHRVLNRLDLLIAAATDCETAERGYVITGDDSYLEPYQHSAQLVDVEGKELRRLTADNPAQLQRLDAVVALATERLANLSLVIQLRRDRGLDAAKTEILTGKGKRFHDQIRGLIDQMAGVETSLLAQRERSAHHSSTMAQAIILGGSRSVCDSPGLCR
jgi:CHASE3 domain sensor protein